MQPGALPTMPWFSTPATCLFCHKSIPSRYLSRLAHFSLRDLAKLQHPSPQASPLLSAQQQHQHVSHTVRSSGTLPAVETAVSHPPAMQPACHPQALAPCPQLSLLMLQQLFPANAVSGAIATFSSAHCFKCWYKGVSFGPFGIFLKIYLPFEVP